MLQGETLEILDASRDRLRMPGVFHGAEVCGESSNREPVLARNTKTGSSSEMASPVRRLTSLPLRIPYFGS